MQSQMAAQARPAGAIEASDSALPFSSFRSVPLSIFPFLFIVSLPFSLFLVLFSSFISFSAAWCIYALSIGIGFVGGLFLSFSFSL